MIELKKSIGPKQVHLNHRVKGVTELDDFIQEIEDVKEAFLKEGLSAPKVDVSLETEPYYDSYCTWIVFESWRSPTKEESEEYKANEQKEKDKQLAGLKKQYENLKKPFEEK